MVRERKQPPSISDRQLQGEVRKQLMQFAYDEFSAKKPLELRVIQLKPQTVFQKGENLPSMVIKTLKLSHYVVYLDFGEDIRFYFYDRIGQSLGASTFPKSEKMLNEMHGKGNTILKLPKKSPTEGLDVDSMQITELFKDTAQRWSQKLGFPIPEIPPISVVKSERTLTYLRVGILYEEGIYHFEKICMDPTLAEFILLRELYPLIFRTENDNETIQWLATLWALGQFSTEKIQKIYLFLKRIKAESPVIIKGLEWMNHIYHSWIQKKMPLIKILADGIYLFGEYLIKSNYWKDWTLWTLIPLWIMKYGEARISKIMEYQVHPALESKIITEIAQTLYRDQQLWQNYHISLDETCKSPEFWLHAYCQTQRIIISEEREFASTLDSISILPEIQKRIPQSQQWPEILEKRHISEWFTSIPNDLRTQCQRSIKMFMDEYFINMALIFQSPDSISMETNTDYRVAIHIHNQSDWVFYQAQFDFRWQPENRCQIRNLEQSRSLIFDIDRKLNLLILPYGIGKVKINIILQYEDPFNGKIIATLPLREISVMIHESGKTK